VPRHSAVAAAVKGVRAEAGEDLHALRTTYITSLATAGVHPRSVQAPARHGSIQLTMGTYCDMRLVHLKSDVERLPLPTPETTPRKAGWPLRV
jgi:hypothetical protein